MLSLFLLAEDAAPVQEVPLDERIIFLGYAVDPKMLVFSGIAIIALVGVWYALLRKKGDAPEQQARS